MNEALAVVVKESTPKVLMTRIFLGVTCSVMRALRLEM